ncbi:MAG: phosphoenolpyruvate carboxykinase (GTP) [Thermoplasmata archaeon]|nr:phosphoenolpyruvate carboxykinase (GTP) [Thermoplasmata archaeon]
MINKTRIILEEHLQQAGLERLYNINNPELHDTVAKFIELCQPSSVFVASDAPADWNYIRQSAMRNHEESPLKLKNHTVHYDAYGDQGRDKKNTRYLLDDPNYLEPELNQMDRNRGLDEMHGLMNGIMKGKEMFVCFFSLGPVDSQYAIPCLQITDSAYVAHSEHILYRTGYRLFERHGRKAKFFRLIHSEGRTSEGPLGLMVCDNLDSRRVYIDIKDETVYSVNTQYGGNSIGMKKLAMRLAINRACSEDWLTEHMFIMSVSARYGRKVYLTGAFPSMCGKTSTTMVPGESILGDDIAFLRNAGDCVRAVNVEKGMFGVIHGINPKDDELQWKALRDPQNEVIFSNVLVKPDGDIYWDGMDKEIPEKGINHSGVWQRGKKDPAGKEIPVSHKNARFSISLDCLDNVDMRLEDPVGVKVRGMIYGGRDSDTWVPVEEAFDWQHGIITKGASLESETTAATLGQPGVMTFNPMSNLDFLSVPVGTYVQKNLEFGAKCQNPPRIFSVNYFLKDTESDTYLNTKTDKHIWLKWIANRVHEDADAVRTPTGMIPTFGDLKEIFKEVSGRNYSQEDYVRQFSFWAQSHLHKIDRLLVLYRDRVKNTPPVLFEVMEAQRARIDDLRNRKGDIVSPFDL